MRLVLTIILTLAASLPPEAAACFQQGVPSNPPPQTMPPDQQARPPDPKGGSGESAPGDANTAERPNAESPSSSSENNVQTKIGEESHRTTADSEPKQDKRAPTTDTNPPSKAAPPTRANSPGSVSAKTVPHRHASRKPPRATPADKNGPKKVFVREGGATEPPAQILTGMAPEEAAHGRQAAERSLDTTDQTLSELEGRSLNDQQQETVSQIQNYMHGARTAIKDGDVSRAQTLALKAKLLAEDLVKH
jgi:hypothetical protein